MLLAFSFHGFESADVRWSGLRRRMYRESIRRCDGRWSVSHSAAAALARELSLNCEEFELLPNGVDSKRFRPPIHADEIRRCLGLPCDRVVLLSVGHLKHVKGHDVLLDAIRRLGSTANGLCVVLVGDDQLDGALHRFAAEHLSHCDIRFVGQQDDVLPWCQSADIFVQPSRWEGCSNALLEAMSCGLPSIASDTGGNRDLIKHERTGLLVQPDDASALAAAIRGLADEPMRRNCLGQAARRWVIGRHDLNLTLVCYADRYHTLGKRIKSAISGAQPA